VCSGGEIREGLWPLKFAFGPDTSRNLKDWAPIEVGQDKKNVNIDALLGKRAARSQTKTKKIERTEILKTLLRK
jgi:hypothetical protein